MLAAKKYVIVTVYMTLPDKMIIVDPEEPPTNKHISISAFVIFGRTWASFWVISGLVFTLS